jgi:hypothetical protein
MHFSRNSNLKKFLVYDRPKLAKIYAINSTAKTAKSIPIDFNRI